MAGYSTTKKLMLSYIALLLALLALLGATLIPARLESLSRTLDNSIALTARLLAEDSAVAAAVQSSMVDTALQARLDTLVADIADVDYVVLVDTADIRIYHPDRSRMGQPFSGGDEAAALQGAAPYLTTGQGTTTRQRRAFHSVFAPDGAVLGFVLVSASVETIHHQRLQLILELLALFGFALCVGVLLALAVSRSIRRALLGFEPSAFARMYLQQESILDNLAEGIAAIAPDGTFLYRNATARATLSGARLEPDFPLLAEVAEVQRTGTGQSNRLLTLGEHTLLAKLLPLAQGSPATGTLLIFRDRTEYVHMAEQMTGANHIVEALRASTHEYLNKLHVISGLLQIGETRQAIEYISGVTADAENGYQTIVRQIEDRTVAALLLGKASRARELGVAFTLRRDSHLAEQNPYLSTHELVTVVGNLIENAFDAVKTQPEPRQVEAFLGADALGLTISVDDTGHGMTGEQIETLRRRQYTTKGEGHGVGLRLVQQIVAAHEGYLEIESVPGEGSSFTASFDKQRCTESSSTPPATAPGKDGMQA